MYSRHWDLTPTPCNVLSPWGVLRRHRRRWCFCTSCPPRSHSCCKPSAGIWSNQVDAVPPSFLSSFFFGPLPCLNLSSAKFGLRVKRFQEMAALVGGPGLWPSSQRVKCHFSWYSCLKRQCFTCWIRFAHWLKRPDDTLHIVLTHPWLWNSVLVLVRLIYWTVKITFPTRQQQASH